MLKRKSIETFLLTAVLCISITACGSSANTAGSETSKPDNEQEQVQSASEQDPQEDSSEDDTDSSMVETESTTSSESLDEQLEEAVELGIIDEEMARRADETAIETEIPGMLQAVHKHGYGHESAYLTQMAEYAGKRRASRYWFAMGMFYPYCEEYYGKQSTDIEAFMNEMDDISPEGSFGLVYADNIGVLHNSSILNNHTDDEGEIHSGAVWDLCVDADALFDGSTGWVWRHDYGNWWVAQIPFAFYDRMTGEKVLDMDEDQNWNPADVLTIGDAAKAALRYWHYFEEPAEKVSYDEVGTYDPTIITDDLLSKETDLPYNDCSDLPSEWHGILFNKLAWVSSSSFNPDCIVRNDDIRIVKDAGLNFIKLNLSFSYLQAPDVENGLLNETRLKTLDNVLAMCMENDIHLCIAASQKQDVDEYADFYEMATQEHMGLNTEKEIADFAAVWGALARRYADIPNEYLSFNLFNEYETSSDEQYKQAMEPAIEAIRAESPDRTIIADVCDARLTGSTMAELGVALSYHQYDPREFCAINEIDYEEQNDPDYLHSVTWPFTSSDGESFDAEKLLSTPMAQNADAISLKDLISTAKENGVGAMVGEFGIFGEYDEGFSRYRYTDETLQAFYSDMISVFEEEGLGWVVGPFNSTWGIVQPYPCVEGADYEKVGYWYVDTAGQNFFKSLE